MKAHRIQWLVCLTGLVITWTSIGIAAGHAQNKKKEPSIQGSFQYGKKSFKLTHGIAYQNKVNDNIRYFVMITDQSLPGKELKKLKASLKKKGNDDDFTIFDPFFHLALNFPKDRDQGSLGASVMLPDGGGFTAVKLKSEVKVSGNRVSGKVSMLEAAEVFDTKYRFEVRFDVELIDPDKWP